MPSSPSLLATVTVVARRPLTEGSKVTVKVVEPLGAMVTGVVIPPTVKSAASPPATLTEVTCRGARPVFSMVKVWTAVCTVVLSSTATLPNSVSSAAAGVVSPSAMEVLLPVTPISGSVPVPWMVKL